MEQINRVKTLESESKWDEAAREWEKLGEKDKAKTCRYIADAIREGDEYRRSIPPEPDRYENPQMV